MNFFSKTYKFVSTCYNHLPETVKNKKNIVKFRLKIVVLQLLKFLHIANLMKKDV